MANHKSAEKESDKQKFVVYQIVMYRAQPEFGTCIAL